MLFGDAHDGAQGFFRVHGTRRVVGVDDDDAPGAWRDQPGDSVRIRLKAGIGVAGIMHGLALIERDTCRPQRIVGTGYQDLVTRIQQGPQGEIDELTDAISNKDVLS